MSAATTDNTATIYFSLAPLFFAAHYEGTIIILNGNNDKYISLIDSAAYYFNLVLTQPFHCIDEFYTPTITCNEDSDSKKLNYWIKHFLAHSFITRTSDANRSSFIKMPLKKGGLVSYRWD